MAEFSLDGIRDSLGTISSRSLWSITLRLNAKAPHMWGFFEASGD